jgi:hypothetical protein
MATKSQLEQIIYAPETSAFSSVIVFDKYNKSYKVTQSADINITLAASGHIDDSIIKITIVPDNVHALTIDTNAFCVSGAFDRSQGNIVILKTHGLGFPPTANILNIPYAQVDYTRSFVTSNNANNVITLNNTDGLLSFAVMYLFPLCVGLS